MDETAQAIEFAKSGAWVPLSSLVIVVLVRLSKSDAAVAWWPLNVHPRMRAAGALVLGFAAGIAKGLASGGHWPAAFAGGLVAAALAITAHEVVVEGFRDGRDIGIPRARSIPPMFPPAIVLVLILGALCQAACGTAARSPVPTVVEAAYVAELTAAYAAARSCPEARDALTLVEERWAPAWMAFERPPAAPPTLRCSDGGR